MTTNYTRGHLAEEYAADFLEEQGFTIQELNWKTRWCEIDIIAIKQDVVYLVEVKYRKSTKQGMGLDYITQQKLKQMQFAAELWVSNNNWLGEYQLAAVEITGQDFRVTNFVTEI